MMRLIFIALISILALGCSVNGEQVENLYGPTEPVQYLTGRFSPNKHPDFVSLEKYGIPTSRPMLLRREAAEALSRMMAALKRDHPGIPFRVVSATRNWYSQRGIWERKWNGRQLVGGQKLNQTIPDHARRALKILEYSSMPGTSRHHWGTDVDLNNFTNSYFKKGKGKTLYAWLQKNAGRFGFCQPYTVGREAGYLEERWHWSYLPLARPLLDDWLRRVKTDRQRLMGTFAGSNASIKLAPIYVETINPACK